ncbi:MAG TPA: tRNA epoxyqueuosine(34) reductase QueG [Candidatus Sulfotelmatobacter sp.]|nr:tRNA epoxyqueuosine(34) reductase QueG [Candidatus Sulfotelmatobacter sp.]
MGFTISDIKAVIDRAAASAGFELAGIAPAVDAPELAYFPEWIAAGRPGEMKYMEARDERGDLKRASLARVAPWARSVIVCAINYNTDHPYSTEFTDSASGWISRYAWSEVDYHEAVLRRLKRVETAISEAVPAPLELKTRAYVDTGPIVERIFAKYAGIGWVGKNTCIINQKLGSWLFLGVILSSIELPPDTPAPDRCGTCTRCIQACPTDAILAPYQLDSNKCISYLTIEKRGSIPEELRPGMGRHLFGCDICQDVCPWNRKSPISPAPEFEARPGLVNPSLERIATMEPEEFRQTFRGSAIRRAKRSGLRRNAVIAMGNSKNPDFLPLLQRLARDEDEAIAESAKSAEQRLQSQRK